jgi:hypothetical protein
MKTFIKDAASLISLGVLGFFLLYFTDPILWAIWDQSGDLIILALLALLALFSVLLIILVYRYLKELSPNKQGGVLPFFLYRSALFRIAPILAIFATLYFSIVLNYLREIESNFYCSESPYLYEGKRYTVQSCTGPRYYSGNLVIRRLSIFDEKGNALSIRDFIDRGSIEDEFHILYWDGSIEYGYDKERIHFPISPKDQFLANLSILSIDQFLQYASLKWRHS